jgi:OHCU decarboxylase
MSRFSNIPDHSFSNYRPSQMGRGEFTTIFGNVFEHSPWIVMQAWDTGLTARDDTAAGLCNSFIDVVETAGREAQLALLRAHPDLAGRLARQGGVTDASRNEQASAGLNDCSDAEFKEFQDLNWRYTEKFNFPFILAVRERHRTEILEVFKRRVENDVENEFKEALWQVFEIARLRLREIQ